MADRLINTIKESDSWKAKKRANGGFTGGTYEASMHNAKVENSHRTGRHCCIETDGRSKKRTKFEYHISNLLQQKTTSCTLSLSHVFEAKADQHLAFVAQT